MTRRTSLLLLFALVCIVAAFVNEAAGGPGMLTVGICGGAAIGALCANDEQELSDRDEEDDPR